MKRGLVFAVLLGIMLISLASAATVSHLAEQVRAGVFGQNYTGNWSFVNGRVGVGTTQPLTALHVNGSTPAGAEAPSPQFDKVVIDDNDYSYINFRTANTGVGGLIFSDDSRATAYINYNHGTGNFGIVGGNVGIGTSSPSGKLNIYTTDDSLGLLNVTDWDSNPSNYVAYFYRPSNLGVTPTVSNAAVVVKTHSNDFGLSVLDHSDNPLFNVKGNGYVGIGTNSPTNYLYVNLSAGAGGGLSISEGANQVADIGDGSSSGQTGIMRLYESGTEKIRLYAYSGAGGYTFFNAGNVGIGITSPGYPLSISSDGSRTISFIPPTASGAGTITTTGTGNGLVLKSNSASNQLFLADNGYVGIGTATPRSSLDLGGNYIQIKTASPPPPGAACDSSSEYGRMFVADDLSTNDATLYICVQTGVGTYGWDGIAF